MRGLRSTHRIAVLHPQVVVFEVDVDVWQNELYRHKHMHGRQAPASATVVLALERHGHMTDRVRTTRARILGLGVLNPLTSSRIFFQMIRVISSPSISTTGFLTFMRSPTGEAYPLAMRDTRDGTAEAVGRRGARRSVACARGRIWRGTKGTGVSRDALVHAAKEGWSCSAVCW